MTARPSPRILAIARQVENVAAILPDAIAEILRRELASDGYTGDSGEPHVTSSSSDTPTESACLSRIHWANVRAEYDADINALAIIADGLVRRSRKLLAGDTLAPTGPKPRTCDPSGREGALVPLVDGGWADFTCRDGAVKDGLCGKHYHAERRYRQAKGLPTRKSIQPAWWSATGESVLDVG